MYEFTTTLDVIGVYSFIIYLKNDDGLYERIKGNPFYLHVYPNEPSYTYTLVSGSGVKSMNIGRVEHLTLEVMDIFNNQYDQLNFKDNLVYKVSCVCNETFIIPVNLTYKNPGIGLYKFELIILDFFVEATVTV